MIKLLCVVRHIRSTHINSLEKYRIYLRYFRWYMYLLLSLVVNEVKRYVGHLESKERLRIQPAQLLHCTRSVMWCVQ
jgi:hypothetical protein